MQSSRTVHVAASVALRRTGVPLSWPVVCELRVSTPFASFQVERDVRASSLLAVLQDKLNLAPESAVLTYKGQVRVIERAPLASSVRAALRVSRK